MDSIALQNILKNWNSILFIYGETCKQDRPGQFSVQSLFTYPVVLRELQVNIMPVVTENIFLHFSILNHPCLLFKIPNLLSF